MAKTIVLNHTDSGVSGVTTLALDRAIINYGLDFRVKTQDASQAILTNMTSPVDKPETYRAAVNVIKDVYKGTNVDAAQYSPSRKGVSLLNALNDIYTVTDSVTGLSYDLPISGHFVLKIPSDGMITTDIVIAFLGRLVSGIYDSGSATNQRLAAMLRGSLLPTDL